MRKALGTQPLFLILLTAFLLDGCAEEQTPPPCAGDSCSSLSDTLEDKTDIEIVEEDSGPQTDTQEIPDIEQIDDSNDIAESPDTDTPDIAGPFLLSTSPDGEEEAVLIPFVVKLTFSEAIRPETVDSTTFVLLDSQGNEKKCNG